MNVNTRIVALVGAMATAAAVAHAGNLRRSLQDHEVVMDKELLITAPEVVDSAKARYPGPWSFGFLMEQAFTRDKAPAVLAEWLQRWTEGTEKPVVPGRPGVDDLVRQWQDADGYKPDPDDPWRPDFANAPFRLLAIANRMDLAVPFDALRDEKGRVKSPLRGSGPVYYQTPQLVDSSGGEGRFVFAALDKDGEPMPGGTTLIFEYGLHGDRKQEGVMNWAMDWHALGRYREFDGGYLAALADVTGKFTRRVKRDRGPDTQLIRIRTNDGSYGMTREFREFRVSADGLTHGELAGTPRVEYFERGTRENRWLARWLRMGQGGLNEATTVRDKIAGGPHFNLAFPTRARPGSLLPVVAMVAPVPGNNADYHWDGYSMKDAALRRSFSLQTCCGCHCGDTGTAFFHIEPRRAGEQSQLSDFMRMDGKVTVVDDPGSRRQVELNEMLERRLVFESLLNPDVSVTRVRQIRAKRLARAH